MDHGLLVIFLLASCWLYFAIILALNDWRWHAGRIGQYLLCALLGGWLVLVWAHPDAERRRVALLAGAIGLFALNVVLPVFAQRRRTRLLLLGRIRRARLWQRVVLLLAWRRPSALFGGLPPDAVDGLPEGSLEARRSGRMLARIYAGMSRSAFHHRRIDALVAFGHYGEAASVYEEQFEEVPLLPEAELLCTISVAYSETGDLRRAAAALREAEEAADGPNQHDLRRFAACVRLYAACGRPDRLLAFLDRNPIPSALVSSAALKYRLGLACLNAGQVDRARQSLIEALAVTGSGEEQLHESIECRLQAVPQEAVAVELPAPVVADLDALESLQARPSVGPPEASRPPRPVVTWGLVATMLLVWLATEWVGSSEDGRTLMQMGANMPLLVAHGEWWRMVSSVFLHVGWLHLFFNAYRTHLFGTFVERMTGRCEVLVTFIVSGIAGSVLSAFLGAHSISAGASGGVFGLLGAATVASFRFKGTFSPRARRFYVTNFLFIAAIGMAHGLIDGHIDNLAHGGGFAAGALIGFVLPRRDGTHLLRTAFRVAAAACVLVVAFSAVRTIRNAAEVAYPMRIPRMQHQVCVDANGVWKIEAPIFWVRKFPGSLSLLLLDPLEGRGRLSGKRYHGGPFAEPEERSGEALVMRGPRRAGRYAYDETYRIATTGEGQEAAYRFQVKVGDFTYIIRFRCDLQDAASYQRLLTRILASLEPGTPEGHPAM